MKRFIQINQADNVGVALAAEGLAKGEEACGVVLPEAITRGHKFALRPIAKGEPVIKYGQSRYSDRRMGAQPQPRHRPLR